MATTPNASQQSPEAYDSIIIGAGQSGPFLAVRLAEAGRRVALIERSTIGGTCVNNGCVPTKTMVASARAAHMARDGARYGVVVGPVRVDYAMVKARRDALVKEFVDGLVTWLDGTDGITTIKGEARFTGPHQVSVNGKTLTAPQIFINAGARPVVPDWPGLEDISYLTNVSLMDLAELPTHLVIIGGSYIGLEFAQMFRRFGSRVTVLEHGPRLVSREDPDISNAIDNILANEQIDIVCDAREFSFAPDAKGLAVSFTAGGTRRCIAGSHLLVATGRKPNTEALDLGAAGIATDQRGYIGVDDHLATNVEGVWAMGDINGQGAFTHTSYNDFEIVAANLLDGDDRKLSDRVPAYNLYIDPPLGRAGITETEARQKGIKALIGTYAMSRVGRAREKGETEGMMKVLVDADTKRILGAALLGVECDEVVQALLPLMTMGAPYTALTRTMHIHPTVAELLPSAFADLKPLD